MSRATLNALKRDASGKSPTARRLRLTGQVPGVLYRGGESLPIQVDSLEVAAVLRHGATLVDLVVGDTRHASVIKNYQVHPVRGTLQHIDLQEVRMDEVVKMTVSVTLVGESPGAKGGGVLTQGAHELNIESTPLDIPETIEVDISMLEIGDSLSLSGLTPPSGVTFLDDGETSLVGVTAPRAVEEEDEELEGEEGEAVEGDEAGPAAEGGEPAAKDGGE